MIIPAAKPAVCSNEMAATGLKRASGEPEALARQVTHVAQEHWKWFWKGVSPISD
jgi:hypothetical protein